MHDLGTLSGDASQADSIDDAGQVVGAADTTDDDVHAFMYDGTGMHDLNTLIPGDTGWVLMDAMSIDNAGNIVGIGAVGNDIHGFLLTPA
jgi:probable HAF family extracellular repeat protein